MGNAAAHFHPFIILKAYIHVRRTVEGGVVG